MLRLEISGPCSAVTQTSPQNWLHPADRAAGGGVMDRVCRLLGYVPNAHRDPISINQNSNKKSPVVKPENSRFTYRFHSVL